MKLKSLAHLIVNGNGNGTTQNNSSKQLIFCPGILISQQLLGGQVWSDTIARVINNIKEIHYQGKAHISTEV